MARGELTEGWLLASWRSLARLDEAYGGLVLCEVLATLACAADEGRVDLEAELSRDVDLEAELSRDVDLEAELSGGAEAPGIAVAGGSARSPDGSPLRRALRAALALRRSGVVSEQMLYGRLHEALRASAAGGTGGRASELALLLLCTRACVAAGCRARRPGFTRMPPPGAESLAALVVLRATACADRKVGAFSRELLGLGGTDLV